MYYSPTKNKFDRKAEQKKKVIDHQNLLKFESEWELVNGGLNLANYQLRIITEELAKNLAMHKDLVSASKELSKNLIKELGSEYWNVILVSG